MGSRTRKHKQRGGQFGAIKRFTARRAAAAKDTLQKNLVKKQIKAEAKDVKKATNEWSEHYRILYWISKALQVLKALALCIFLV